MSSNNDELENRILVFGMKNILIETALDDIQVQGIDLGRQPMKPKEEIVDTELFEHDILVRAKRMADFYVLYYALENSVRRLITQVLSEKHPTDWWQVAVPDGVRQEAEKKQKAELETAMSIRSDESLAYTSFGELITIIMANWDEFKEILRSQKSVQETLSDFSKIRNIIAHSCDLSDEEIPRLKLLINDWFLRIQTES